MAYLRLHNLRRQAGPMLNAKKVNTWTETEIWGLKSDTIWFLYFTQVVYHLFMCILLVFVNQNMPQGFRISCNHTRHIVIVWVHIELLYNYILPKPNTHIEVLPGKALARHSMNHMYHPSSMNDSIRIVCSGSDADSSVPVVIIHKILWLCEVKSDICI